MKKVALDIDGVVANVPQAIKEKLKGYNNLTFNEYHPKEMDEKVFHDVIDSILSNQDIIVPYRNALYMVPEIDKFLGPITFITARRNEYNKGTLKWLSDNFPSVSFTLVNKPSSEKPLFVKDEGFDFFVEDRLKTANISASMGIKTFLINHPWNIGRKTHKDVIRVRNLIAFFSIAMTGV